MLADLSDGEGKPRRKVCVFLSVHPHDDGQVFFKEIRSTLAAGTTSKLLRPPRRAPNPSIFMGRRSPRSPACRVVWDCPSICGGSCEPRE